MTQLNEQLIEKGFSSNFTPEDTEGKFKEYKDENLGKLSYIYKETTSDKGTFKQFTYIIWSIMSEHETLLEFPDGLSKKDKAEFDKLSKKEKAKYKALIEEKHLLASMEAKKIYNEAKEPKFVPEYLKNKGLDFLKDYKVDPENGDTIIIPIFAKNGEIQTIQKIFIDGTKQFLEGGKVQGSFGVIHGEGDTLYICEGFATAISIHLATKQTVTFVLSSNNFEKTVPNIMVRIPKEFNVICADDDRHLEENKGLKEATRVALKQGISIKTPVFQKYDGKNTTDFDDLRRLEGIETVLQQVSLSDKEKLNLGITPGVTCLGHKAGYYFLSSTKNQTVQSFSSLEKSNLFKLMPLEFWLQRYGVMNANGVLSIDYDEIASNLMDQCHNIGVYYGSNIRGIGCYDDLGRKVIHLGDRLLVDNVLTPLRGIKTKYTYTMTEKINDISREELSDADVQEFVKYLELSTLKSPISKYLICGWLVSSILAGMLEWRPHIYITGKRGSGKTQLTELVYKILSQGFHAVYTHGIQTTAVAVRQKINSNAIPVIFDEVEGDSKKTQANAVSYISLCRIASSNSEASTILGSASQSVFEFKVSFCAWIAGIMPQLQQDSDKSRFAMVETFKDPNDLNLAENWASLNRYWQSIDEEWSRKFVARVIRNSDLIIKNINATRRHLLHVHNKDARFADQFGTLMGASFAFKHLREVTPQELDSVASQLLENQSVIEDTSNGEQELECLKHILAAKIKDSSGMETRIQRELMRSSISDDIFTVMGEFGVIPCENENQKGVFIRDTGDIRFHLRTLPNFEIAYLKALARIEGAKKMKLTFQGNRCHGVFIPMDKIFTDMNEMDEEVPF